MTWIGPRVTMTMGEDIPMLRFFARTSKSGVPVVAIMADEPDTPFSVITLKKDNYKNPSQLKGKKISWFQTNVKGLLEPLLIVGMGLVVMLIVLAVLLPIIQLNQWVR